ncbi:glycoside hydrolase family 16 protein [Trametes versicolor FP-101664 SS1]|uniref:glycoside hydrolase family 16 protein n=1 Tax=Trametes versicolor (strain FP-101664) TaxID=717944 RepID=UPI00046213DA|nr:glycoside hydrolase family 16 protein [Trametes versicolor FP-101664 SS1]EIW54979.1 glycoside hydrolase family 16 protein [Trametes versicolor FP-101664 SS1]
MSDKFALPADPSSWGAALTVDQVEPDDHLHNPDPRRDKKTDRGGHIFTCRGITNLGFLFILGVGMLTLFAGYPIIDHFNKVLMTTLGGFNLGGVINATGQLAAIPGNWGLIDLDTPSDAYTFPDFNSGKDWQLIWSDEFETDGRTFYPGDDPYWEAVDLHYWGTNNMEWYDPAAITTRAGALEITLSVKQMHGLDYQGGMMSTWNKFCFTGGLVLASVVLPGVNNVVGLWPAIWSMGNLGRAGYGGSLDGMWPYTYDSCDVGTVANQTLNDLPTAATVNGDASAGSALSYLPGQKLSRCTCPGESHPGPIHADGTYVGRAAPEIDMFEAQITGQPLSGQVSQSAQWAPFNAAYTWFNSSDTLIIPDPVNTFPNPYKGSAFQQASSGVTETNQQAYEHTGNVFSVYGFQYKPGFEGAYISWIADGKLAWTLTQEGFAADPVVEIGPRPVPQEPMYLIANLGMSRNFGFVDLDHLIFPATMRDFPTAAYINEYIEVYTNPNLTTWRDDYGQPFPKNSFLGEC